MDFARQKTVTYCARAFHPQGKTVWYLGERQGYYRWVKVKDDQLRFKDENQLLDAIVEAGGPDKRSRPGPGGWVGTRRVIIETDTHEEILIGPRDYRPPVMAKAAVP
jgi:hypothetical protein